MVATCNEVAIAKVVEFHPEVLTHILDQLGIYHNENSQALKQKPRRIYFFAKSAGRCFTPVIEIKPNTFSPQ